MGFLIKWLLIIGVCYYILKYFVFPTLRVTIFTSHKMREMQDKMRDMEQKMNQTQQQRTSTKSNKEDYIDYEEVK